MAATLVSSITTGNAQNVGSTGSANASTGATTLTLQEMVSGKVQPYLDRADAIATQIDANSQKIASYQQMQTLLMALQSSMANLTTQALEGENSFYKRVATMTSSGAAGVAPSDASALISAAVESRTAMGTHTIVVKQVAQVEVDLSNTLKNTTTTQALGKSGTFQIYQAGKGAGVDITVSETDSLTDIASKINNVTGQTGVTASVVALSSSESVLVLTGSDENQKLSFKEVSGSVLTDIGVVKTNGDGALVAANQTQAAQPAELIVNGVAGITRDSNVIDDVIDGVTLTLKGEDANTKISLTVGADVSSIAGAIQNFVTAYNAWKGFVATNQATKSDGSAADTAILFGDSTLRVANTTLGSQIASMAAGVTDYSSAANLAGIGISLNSSNQLVINTVKLTAALTTNYQAVAALFQNTTSIDSSTADSGTTLKVAGTNYSTYAGSLTFRYDGGVLKVLDASNKDVSSSFSVNGSIISANSGSEFSGLRFSFSGTGALGTAIMTEGLANQIYATSKTYGNPATGSVQKLVSSLQDKGAAMTSRHTLLMAQAQNYTTYLTEQYASLSAKITTANQTLLVLKALLDAGKK
ncbi:MAG: flagellar filament capping protein FliD [Rhodospirillaceae bacterium]|nr:flagellar filament capping protein FliD [Rhodospirillaceae bacterium]